VKPCPANTSDGKRCRSRPRKGRKWCWFHDPKSAKARATAQANGGAESRNRVGPAKTLGKRAPKVDVSSEEPIRALVQETVDQVRQGKIAPTVGQVIGQLLTVALRSLKQDETEKKVKELDERTRPFIGLKVEELLEIVRGGHAAPPAAEDAAPPN
jgi:hypothetical protein